jgi:NAD dependent epimerase/dehydratase
MEKVLVTGADGFIGSHLVETLMDRGFQVRALVNYNSFNSWGWLDDMSANTEVEIVSGDIRDAYFCQSLCKGIDTVFHLAALIAIPYSYQAPASYLETNIRGTLNICQAALHNGVQRLIHTSTSEVYGSALYVPIDEKHPLQPQSPYSASKIAADAMAMSFFHAFGLPLTIARPFNTYGPRQSARAVIPAIITQITSGKRRIELGDVTPTRDFNYVLDTCNGFLALAESANSIGETVNIGSGVEISIGEALNLIKVIMDREVDFIVDEQRLRPKNSEVQRLCCDNTKIHALTGFQPQYSLEAGLRLSIDWFSKPENLKKYKADIYNV